MASMSGFTSRNLSPDQVHTVYPLVREAIPTLDLKTWTRAAKRIANAKRMDQVGIRVVFRSPRQLPCGLFLYRRDKDLGYGPILAAEYFVALDVLDPAPVVRALAEEMDALAQRLGCAAIRALVRRHSPAVDAGLREAGLVAEGAMLWKRLPPG